MTIVKELDALHVNWEEYKFPAGEWDMKYADFSLVEKTGATVTLDLFSEIEPAENFTINAPSEIKEGQTYILRVVTWATPYTMTLWTWITNPYSESTTLVANTVHQFGFLAIDWDLELQPSVTQSWWWTWWTITWTLSDQTDLNTALNWKQDKATSWSSAPAVTPSYIWQQYVDTTNNKMYVAKWTTSSNDWIEVWAWSWDMLYQDFNWVTKTWATVTLDINSTITPSANFTVNAPSTIKDWQIYILRVTNWATAYTMTLGTWITNPYSTSTTLTANWVDQFVFQAIGWSLELLPDSEIDITGKQDKATSWSTAPATVPSYVGQQYVDTTNNKLYVATWTTSSSDWTEIGVWGWITIWTTAPSPASAWMLWYDTTSTIKALKWYDWSSWKIIGPEIVPITQADYDLLSLDEQNNWKFYLIVDSQWQVVVAWSDITGKPSDLTAVQIQTWSSTTAWMVSPSVISASMPRLSTQTWNLSELKFWIWTTTAYQKLDSYDDNTVYICKKVIS